MNMAHYEKKTPFLGRWLSYFLVRDGLKIYDFEPAFKDIGTPRYLKWGMVNGKAKQYR